MTSFQDRRLLAVMFTDVVGYTALMQRDEEEARIVRRRHRQALDTAVPAHGGDLLQYLGDGSFTTFPSVVDAVRAAIEVQHALRQDPVVPLRIGIHQGDITYDTQGPYGDSVNIASRIQSLGTAGSILVSAKAHDEIKNQHDISTTPLGDFELKNVDEPLAVYAIVSDEIAVPTRGDVLTKIQSEPASRSDASVRLNTALAGRYRVEGELGQGGMAVVYLAVDLRHDRKVALKVLRPELSAVVGADRFLTEIKTTANLQHPHILGLHDSGEADGFLFYVMPFVDGETLRQHLDARKQLGLDEALRIATQVSEALDYAHRHGVLHRDIKPENILLQDGQAVVADFGIALAVSAAGGDRLTETGLSLGTPEYMSPEQASADRQLSPESDIYSLGCVLYEMLVGDPPHLGSTAQAIMAKILTEEPTPVSVLRDTVPASMEAAIHRALKKTPADRFASAVAFTEALTARSEPPQRLAPQPRPTTATADRFRGRTAIRRVGYVGATIGLMATAAAVTLGVLRFAGPAETGPVSAPMHRQITFAGDASDAAISPDGTSVVYVTGRAGEHQRLMLADLAGGQAIEIFNASLVLLPAWSPDGSALTVSALRDQPSPARVYRIPRLGGDPRRLGPGAFTTWSPDGSQIAFALEAPTGFSVFSESTGETDFTALDGYDFNAGISWSPNGDRLAMLTATASGLYELFTVDPSGNDRRSVIALPDPMSSPRWAPGGDAIYFLRHKNNLAELLRVDLTSDGDTWGEPAVVLSGLQATRTANSTFNLTADGRTLVYSTRLVYSNLWLAELAGDASDQLPQTRQLTSGTALIEGPSISPDGRWIAYSAQTSGGANIFKMPLTGGDPVQLTFSDDYQTSPAWAPDGSSIAFTARDAESASVWVMRSDGTQPQEFPQAEVSADEMRVVWSPGDRPLYQRPGNRNFSYLDVATGEQRPLLRDEGRGWNFYPEYSPDGTRVAITWNRPPQPALWLITREPYSERMVNEEPLSPIGWSSDGRWIYVIQGFPFGSFVGRVPATGGDREALFTLPGDVTFASVDDGGARIVAAVRASQSDVFVVEDFDPRQR